MIAAVTTINLEGLNSTDARIVSELVERLKPTPGSVASPQRDILPDVTPEQMAGIYEVLSRRCGFGEMDLAERHNEHQP